MTCLCQVCQATASVGCQTMLQHCLVEIARWRHRGGGKVCHQISWWSSSCSSTCLPLALWEQKLLPVCFATARFNSLIWRASLTTQNVKINRMVNVTSSLSSMLTMPLVSSALTALPSASVMCCSRLWPLREFMVHASRSSQANCYKKHQRYQTSPCFTHTPDSHHLQTIMLQQQHPASNKHQSHLSIEKCLLPQISCKCWCVMPDMIDRMGLKRVWAMSPLMTQWMTSWKQTWQCEAPWVGSEWMKQTMWLNTDWLQK